MMNKYSEGKIYKIVNSLNDKIYVGSTIDTLHIRFRDHKNKAKNKKNSPIYKFMFENGSNNFSIVLLEEWPCNNKKELLMREGYQQVQHNSIKNGLNVNYAYLPPFVIKKKNSIVSSEYYYKNIEDVSKRKELYRTTHREEIAKQAKEYRKKNSEIIAIKRKLKYQLTKT